MINLFIDLDSTLIYSHHHDFEGKETVVAEYLNDKVQSYITQKTFDFLSRNKEINLIPVTARRYQQYSRLEDILLKIGCRYSMICSGGILLKDGVSDEKWHKETIALAGDEIAELPKAEKWFKTKSEDINITENILIYAKIDNPEEAAKELESVVDTSLLNVHFDSRKVYCIPKSINKGNALKRFREYTGLCLDVAAGDALPDVPMLEEAETAIYPEWLADKIQNPHRAVWNKEGCFSDFICDILESML